MGVGPDVRLIRPPYRLDVLRSRRQRQRLAWLLGAGLGVGALVTVFVSSGGIEDVLDALERVTLGWTLAAVVSMLVGYLLLALQMRRLAQGKVSWAHAVRTDLLLFGLGNVLPGAPAPGAILAAAELRRAGMSARGTRFVLAFTAWFNVRTLLGLGAVTFLIALAREHPRLNGAGLWCLVAVGLLMLLAATARMAARPATAERTAHVLARVRIGRASGRPTGHARRCRRMARRGQVRRRKSLQSRRARLTRGRLLAGRRGVPTHVARRGRGQPRHRRRATRVRGRDPRFGTAVAARRFRRGRSDDPCRAPLLRSPARYRARWHPRVSRDLRAASGDSRRAAARPELGRRPTAERLRAEDRHETDLIACWSCS